METAPDPGDTKDFAFEKLQELLVWTPDKEKQLSNVVRGITVTNRFGFVVCVAENGFYVVDCSQPQLVQKSSDGLPKPLGNAGAFLIHVPWQPLLVSVNSSGLTLAVIISREGVPVAFLYDVRAFGRKDPKTQPFNTVQLSTNSQVNVVDFSWIPTPEEIFVVVLSNGALGVYSIQGSATTVVGQLGDAIGATCASWSPKGKQFVIGKHDGSIAQYKPDLSLARSIPGPQNLQVSLKNINWLSTFVFAAAYIKPGEIQPLFVIVNAPKTGNPTFTNYGDICAGFSDLRFPSLHLLPVFEWNMLFVASNTALEVMVLACQSQDSTTGWLQLNVDETGRAEIPLVGEDESYPLGIALVTCSSVPVLLISTTHGLIVPFKIRNSLVINGTPLKNICSPHESISNISGEHPQLAIPTPQPSAIPKSPMVSSDIGGKSLFGSASFGTLISSSTDEKKSLFGGLASSPSTLQSPLSKSTNQVPLFGSLSGQVGSTTSSFTDHVNFGGSNITPVVIQAPETTASITITKPAVPPQQSSVNEGTPAKALVKPIPIPTTIISTKSSPMAVMTKPAIAKTIPSAPLRAFLQKVSAHGNIINTLDTSTMKLDDDLYERIAYLIRVLDYLTISYNDASIKTNELESLLEERLHVVAEAKLVLEKCSDPQFLKCLKLLPLDPVQRRKYEMLKENVGDLHHKVNSLNEAIDLELDLNENRQAGSNISRNQITKKMIHDLELRSLKMEKRLRELEIEARKISATPNRTTQIPYAALDASPAELVSRLYPNLRKELNRKIVPEASDQLRRALKNRPIRVTRHEIILFTRDVAEELSSPQTTPSSQTLKPFKLTFESDVPVTKAELRKDKQTVEAPNPKTGVLSEAISYPLSSSNVPITSKSQPLALNISSAGTDFGGFPVQLPTPECNKAQGSPTVPASSSSLSGLANLLAGTPALALPPSISATSAAKSSESPIAIVVPKTTASWSGFSGGLFGAFSSVSSGVPTEPSKQVAPKQIKSETPAMDVTKTSPKPPSAQIGPSTFSGVSSFSNLGVGGALGIANTKSAFGALDLTTSYEKLPEMLKPALNETNSSPPVKSLFGNFGENAEIATRSTGGAEKSKSSLFGTSNLPPIPTTKIESQSEVSSAKTQTSTAPSLFGSSGFGFGTNVLAPSSFAASTAATPTLSSTSQPIFSSSFGAPVTSQPSTMTSSSLFGPTNFGSVPQSTVPATTVTNSPSSAFGGFGFGSGSVSAFGGSSNQKSFGGFTESSVQSKPEIKSTTSGFGSFSAFGTPSQPPQSQLSVGFGFGASMNTTPASNLAPSLSSFSGFKTDSSKPTAGSGFGTLSAFATPQPAFGAVSGFGQSASPGAAVGSGFGASANFGNQPLQSSGGSFIWGNPGGFAAYAANAQSNVSFGALAAQTQNTQPGFGNTNTQSTGSFSFGSASSGTGSGQSSAFTQYR